MSPLAKRAPFMSGAATLLLSGLGDAQMEAYLAAARLRPNTPKTIVDRDALRAALAKARRDGYAVADEELEVGLRSIAVPIRDGNGAVIAALNLSTQTARYSVAELKRTVLPRLMEAAGRIEDYFVVQ